MSKAGPAAPYRVYRDFLAPEEHAAILDWAIASQQRFEPARVGDGSVRPDLRRSLSLGDVGPLDFMLRRRIGDMLPEFIRELRVTSFVASAIELGLVAHNDGAHFVVHSDTRHGGPKSPAGHRMVSAVYYFHREPKSFSGGELRLHRFGAVAGDLGVADVEPAQNSLVVFPSWAPHEVRPVRCPSREFADSRFAVNCWLLRAH